MMIMKTMLHVLFHALLVSMTADAFQVEAPYSACRRTRTGASLVPIPAATTRMGQRVESIQSAPRSRICSTPATSFVGLKATTTMTRTLTTITATCLNSMKSNGDGSGPLPELKRIPSELEGVAIPFLDLVGNSFIECYADSVAEVDGVEYTIGVPCDYSVALCYYDDDEQLVPVELDDELMNDIFPIAESIVADEYGEDLSLQRTPQTLTLVGELDDDEDDDDDDDDEDEDDDEDDEDDDEEEEDDEEEVEVLLTFEHRGREFSLVRLMDPILLVGKTDPNTPGNRLLLTPSESEKVMPLLEEAFVDYHDDEEDDSGIELSDEDDDEDELRP